MNLLHFVHFLCSFESMSKLCERYNRAIDGILQLVSEIRCRVQIFRWNHDVCLDRGEIKIMSISAGAQVENSRNV